jgi:hypothetical protein
MSAPFLFLDYDGVRHVDVVYRTSQGIVLHPASVFESTPLLVAALASYPEVRIVLSTSRVRILDVAYSRKQLPGLQGRVIGATWDSQMVAALLAYNIGSPRMPRQKSTCLGAAIQSCRSQRSRRTPSLDLR